MFTNNNNIFARLINEQDQEKVIQQLTRFNTLNCYEIIDNLIERIDDKPRLVYLLSNYNLNSFITRLINNCSIEYKIDLFKELKQQGYILDYYFLLKELEEVEFLYLDFIENLYGLNDFDYLFSIARKANMFYLVDYFINIKQYDYLIKFKDAIKYECSNLLIEFYKNSTLKDLLDLKLSEIIYSLNETNYYYINEIIDFSKEEDIKLLLFKITDYPINIIKKIEYKFPNIINNIIESSDLLNPNLIKLDVELKYLDKFLKFNKMIDLIQNIQDNVINKFIDKIMSYTLDKETKLYLLDNKNVNLNNHLETLYKDSNIIILNSLLNNYKNFRIIDFNIIKNIVDNRINITKEKNNLFIINNVQQELILLFTNLIKTNNIDLYNIDIKQSIFNICNLKFCNINEILNLTKLIIERKTTWFNELIIHIFNMDCLVIDDIFIIYKFYSNLNIDKQLISSLLLKYKLIVVDDNDLLDVCNICLDDKTNVKTICNHIFHSNCLIDWLNIKNTCPCCLKNF